MAESLKDGGPAFPVQDASTWQGHGMTLRDYFAVNAMPMFVQQMADAHSRYTDLRKSVLFGCATRAYEAADAMLAARERK